MTRERLLELRTLEDKFKQVEPMREHFNSYNPQMNRSAVQYLIAGGNYEPEPKTWEKIRALLKKDIDKRYSKAKLEFENA